MKKHKLELYKEQEFKFPFADWNVLAEKALSDTFNK